MTGIDHLEFRNVPYPQIGPEEILVKIQCVGICGSDVHYLRHGRIGDFVVEKDMILGHECAGKIVEVGKDVHSLQVGDTVALEPGVPCGKCHDCLSGKYNLCKDVKFMATPPYDGAFVQYVAYPANMAFKLPDSMDARQGALLEPLSVGLHAARQGGVTLGDHVVIIGSGCIGLVTLLACKAMGATQITVMDLRDERLAYAKRLGATHTINSSKCNPVEEALKITNGEGFDKVFETAGAAAATQMTIPLVKRGGCVVLVGMPAEDAIPLNTVSLICKEAEIKTVFRYRNIYPLAIEAVSEGKIDVSGIVSHEFKFCDLQKAFDCNSPDVIKIVIDME